jgi:hypothetical protein
MVSTVPQVLIFCCKSAAFPHNRVNHMLYPHKDVSLV